MNLARNRDFILLSSGQLLSMFADWSFRALLLIWVYQLTNSGTAVSLVGLAEAIPLLLLSPIAGVFVDRWSRSRTMVGAVLIRALLLLPLIVVNSNAGLPIIIIIVLLANGVSQFFSSAAAAALPVVVGEDKIGQANSLLAFIGSTIYIIGPAFASILFANLGPYKTIMVFCAIYVVAAPLLFFVSASGAGEIQAEKSSVFSEMIDGLKYVRRSSILAALFTTIFIAMLGFGILNIVDVVFVTRALHLKPETVGGLLSSSGIGELIGGVILYIISSWAAQRYHLLSGITPIISGLIFVIYAFAPTLALTIAIVSALGFLSPAINVSFTTLVQLGTDDQFMGRVMSLLGTSMSVAMILSMSLGGALIDLIGVRQVIGGAAIVLIAAGVFSLMNVRFTPKPKDKKIKRSEDISAETDTAMQSS